MADSGTVWVLYAADVDTGIQHSRVIPETVRVLRTSARESDWDELQAERVRTGLDDRLHTTEIEVPSEIAPENLAAYAERYISPEPGFDFWEDVIGDEMVGGVVYNGNLYAADGEGGVRELTDAERAAREINVRRWDAEREAEQAAREAQRRQAAIDYVTTSAAQQLNRQDLSVADNAIERFLHFQASGLDIVEARREATVEAAWDHAMAVRTREPAGSYSPGIVARGTGPRRFSYRRGRHRPVREPPAIRPRTQHRPRTGGQTHQDTRAPHQDTTPRPTKTSIGSSPIPGRRVAAAGDRPSRRTRQRPSLGTAKPLHHPAGQAQPRCPPSQS